MAKKDYKEYTKEQLIAEVEKLSKRKKYGLVWEEEKTKEKFEVEIEGKLPVLTEEKKKEINGDKKSPTHILIEGDNYHALSVLNYTHSKSIDVIYIDPPYNTGNNDFKYNDKFVDREDSYRHSKWLSFMNKRLKLARNLLKNTGVIFISIDDNEIAQLKLLCDEIFIEKNFIIDIIWNSRKSVSNDTIVSLNHNHTLLYAKNISFIQKHKNDFRLKFNKEKFSNPDNDPNGNWVSDPFDAPNLRPNLTYPIKNPNTGETYMPPVNRCWRTTKEEYQKFLKEGRIVFGKSGKSKPQLKRYATEAEGKGLTPKSIWDDVGTTTNGTQELEEIFGEKKFNNPKPVSFINRILELSSNKNSVILDFFAGSGTTGHSVLEMNKIDEGHRQFILCTNNENNICSDVCYPRVKKIIEGYKSSRGEKKEKVEGLGGNLKYYKTNFVSSEPTHRNKKLLTEKSIDMLCIKEATFEKVINSKDIVIYKNKFKYTAILFNEMQIDFFKTELTKFKLPISVYIFSLEDDDFSEDFQDLKVEIEICSIPEAILKVYRRIYEPVKNKKYDN